MRYEVYEEGLEFGRGLSDTEEATLWKHDLTGQLEHWIDVGTPSPDRIHLASKKSPRVSIVCHKGIEALSRELSKKKLYQADKIDVVLLPHDFVKTIGDHLERTSEWSLVIADHTVTVSLGDNSWTTGLERAPLPQPA